MSCDGTVDEELTAGDDWVWSWTTSNDVSGWSDPVIEIREHRSAAGKLVASTNGDTPTVDLGDTDVSSGVLEWSVGREVTADAPTLVWVEVEVLIDGAATTVYSKQFPVRAQVAVREEVGS